LKGFKEYFTIDISAKDMEKNLDGLYNLLIKIGKYEKKMVIIIETSVI